MKKVLLAIVFAAIALAGCAVQTVQPQSPAQVAAQVCPSLQLTLTSLQGLVGLSEDQAAGLEKASTDVARVCVLAQAAQSTDLRTLAAGALPTILALAKASALPDPVINNVVLAVGAAQIIISQLP